MSESGGGMLSQYGTKYSLPLGTVRQSEKVSVFTASSAWPPFISCFQEYEEVVVPPAKTVPPRATEKLIPVKELDPLARGCFLVGSSFRGTLYNNQSSSPGLHSTEPNTVHRVPDRV